MFVHEHRSPEPPAPPWFPDGAARQRWLRIVAVSEDLSAEERASGLGAHRPPDPGFFAAAHGWVAGHALSTVVGDEEVTGGDFVRTMKQLIDLARQVADVAPDAATRAVAREVAELARRGIVADGAIARHDGATRRELGRGAPRDPVDAVVAASDAELAGALSGGELARWWSAVATSIARSGHRAARRRHERCRST